MDSYLLMVAVNNKVNFIECLWSVHASNSHIMCGAQAVLLNFDSDPNLSKSDPNQTHLPAKIIPFPTFSSKQFRPICCLFAFSAN